MSSLLKWFAVIVILIVFANGARFLYTAWQNYEASDEPNVIDGMIGKTAVDSYLDIQKKSDTFNLPALRTAMTMYYTQNGRYPQTLNDLERSGDVNADIIRDRNGVPFHLKYANQKPVILAAGPDKIHGTTDDVQYPL